MLILSTVVFATVAFAYSRARCFNWFHPLTLYLAFHGLVFVFRPWLAFYFDYQAIYFLYKFYPSEADKMMTLAATNVGLVCFAIASIFFGNEPLRFVDDKFESARKDRLLRSFLLTMALFVPIALYSLFQIWVDRSAGSLTYEMDLSTGTTINVGSNGYLKEAQIVLVPLTMLFAWYFRFRFLALIPLAIFVFLRAGTGGRGPIMVTLFGLACFYLYEKRKNWLNGRILVAIVGAMALFMAIGFDRGASVRALFISEQQSTVVAQESRLKPLEGMDLGNLEFFEFLVYAVPQRTGTYEYFVDQLQIFTEPIPRQLWEDKPIGQPIRLFNLFDYGFPIGITRSLPGEGWVQLGLVGVIIWCSLWGGILGRVYRAFVTSRQTVFQRAAYFSFLPMLIIFYRDGYPITLLRLGLFVFAPIGLWYLLSRMMNVPTADRLRKAAMMRWEAQFGAAPEAPATAVIAPPPPPVSPDRAPAWSGQLVPRAWRNRPAPRRRPA